MAQVAEYKKRIVEQFANLVKDYPIIAVVNVENIPGPQMQAMRAKLRGTAELAMTKQRLMRLALEAAKNERKGVEQLIPRLEGMPAMIFTKQNPFKLASMLRKYKSSAPAKGGQTAPRDIVVKATLTPFAPGPIIAELGSIGLKTGVEKGKVAIKADATVVKQGEIISPKVAEVLTRLGIQPMEIGLDLVAVYDNGTIYARDVLSVDEQEYLNRLREAASNALWLSVSVGYVTSENIRLLISRAYKESKGLSEMAKLPKSAAVETAGEEIVIVPETAPAAEEETVTMPEAEEAETEKEEAAPADKEETSPEELAELEIEAPEAVMEKEEIAEEQQEEEKAEEQREEEKYEPEARTYEPEKEPESEEAELKIEEETKLPLGKIPTAHELAELARKREQAQQAKPKALIDKELIAERARKDKEAEEKRIQDDEIQKLTEKLRKKGTLRGDGKN